MVEKNNKRIYICGKVSGLPYTQVLQKFENAEKHALEVLGYSYAINPLKFNAQDADWHFAMKRCIGNLMQCDAIYMLPDWPQSRGAILERFIASNLGIEIIEADAVQVPG